MTIKHITYLVLELSLSLVTTVQYAHLRSKVVVIYPKVNRVVFRLTYNLRLTINVQFSPDFVGNSRARKPNKVHTKRSNTTGLQYLRTHHQVVSTSYLSFILYSFYFLTICANSPSRLRLHLCYFHQQNMINPWIGCAYNLK